MSQRCLVELIIMHLLQNQEMFMASGEFLKNFESVATISPKS